MDIHGFQKNSTPYARIARSAVPNFLSSTQIWAWWTRLKQQTKPQTTYDKKEKKHCIGDFWQYMLLGSFLMSPFHSLLKYPRYTQRQTVITLKIHKSGLDCLVTAHFCPFVTLVCVSTDTWGTTDQARIQLGTLGVVKRCLRGAQIFQTMSNSFQLYPTYFFEGGRKVLQEVSPTLVTGLPLIKTS